MFFAYSHNPTDPLVVEVRQRREAHDPALLKYLLDAAAKPDLKMSTIDFIFGTIEDILKDKEKPYIVSQDTVGHAADAALRQLLHVFDHPKKYPFEDRGTFPVIKGKESSGYEDGKYDEYCTQQHNMLNTVKGALSTALLQLPNRTSDYLQLLNHSSTEAHIAALSSMPASDVFKKDESIRARLREMLSQEPLVDPSGENNHKIAYGFLLGTACLYGIEEAPALLRQHLTELKGSADTKDLTFAMGFLARRIGEHLGSYEKFAKQGTDAHWQKAKETTEACAVVVQELFPAIGNEIDRMRDYGFRIAQG
jgi:hypothetical protein